MNTNTIYLFRQHGVWYAQYHGPHTNTVIELFGTDVLPTAYSASTTPAEVVEAVQRTHPGVRVQLYEED